MANRSSHLSAYGLAEVECARSTVNINQHRFAINELACEQFCCQRILNRPLNHTLERARAVRRIVARACQIILRCIADLEADFALAHATAQAFELQIDDDPQLLLVKWCE